MSNWFGFAIASILLVILPVWILNLADIPFLYKIVFTIGGIGMAWYATEHGGASKGFIAGRKFQR